MNRRNFLKGTVAAGLLGCIAPNLIANPAPKKVDYGYYPISKIPKFEYVFDDFLCTFDDGERVVYHFWNTGDNNKICVDTSDNFKTIYLRDNSKKGLYKWIKLKDFHMSVYKEVTNSEIHWESKPISDIKLTPPKIKVEFYIA